jgi:copper(I)-binding protein
VAGAMMGAVALAGCGAGQITQTAEQTAAVNGASATVGQIAVRNAQIEFDTAAADRAPTYAAGANAPLEMVIVNTGDAPDRLVSASSPVASSVQISGETEVPGGLTLVVEGAPAAAATPAEPTGTAVPTPTTAPTTAPTTTPAPTTTAPGAAGAERTASIVLTGLREDLQVGPTYPVVLTFERAGDVHVPLPIANPEGPREAASH